MNAMSAEGFGGLVTSWVTRVGQRLRAVILMARPAGTPGSTAVAVIEEANAVADAGADGLSDVTGVDVEDCDVDDAYDSLEAGHISILEWPDLNSDPADEDDPDTE